jgi:hypothetical protein
MANATRTHQGNQNMRPIGLPYFACVFAAAVISLIATSGHAQDAGAQVFLQSVYKTYQTSDQPLDYQSEAKAARYFVPSLAKLLGRYFADFQRTREVGNLDFDPFVFGQDWSPTTKIELKVTPGASADRAIGAARYQLEDGGEATVITLDLRKTAAGWRILDIHWSGQSQSLVQLLSKKE